MDDACCTFRLVEVKELLEAVFGLVEHLRDHAKDETRARSIDALDFSINIWKNMTKEQSFLDWIDAADVFDGRRSSVDR